MQYSFEEVGMERVIAGADAPNTASLRVMEKLGMSYLGNINPSAPEEPYFALHKEDFFAMTGCRRSCPQLKQFSWYPLAAPMRCCGVSTLPIMSW